jgi:DNA-binding MarR family transcriptional regulator
MTRAAALKKTATPAARRLTTPVQPPNDTAAEVLRQFRLVFNAVKAHFQQVEKRAGIGGAQVWALSIVRDHPDIGVGALAKTMDIQQSTASNLVRILVERGLVTVERGGADKRMVQMRVLAAGTRLLRRAPAPFSGVLPEALGKLDAATLRRLKRDLNAVLAVLHPQKRAAQTPLAEL